MAKFKLFIPKLIKLEGGYQNQLTDHGNKNSLGQYVGTNYGISAVLYEDIIGRPPTIIDMKSITKDEAINIYERVFWNGLKAPEIEVQELAELIIDHAVNAGPGRAAKITQEALNEKFGKRLTVDSAIGNLTVAAINSVNPSKLFDAVFLKRQEYYTDLNDPDYTDGWLVRLSHWKDEAAYLAAKYAKPVGLGFLTVAIVATSLFFLIRNNNNS